MQVQAAGLSDVGRVRTNNEDHFVADTQLGLFIVCDGMGGHSAGEVASHICCEVLSQHGPAMQQARAVWERSQNPTDLKTVATTVDQAMAAACKKIFEHSSKDPKTQGMGTTCTMVFLAGHRKGILAHVGDCRLYLLRAGKMHQLSDDHTYVNDLLRRGALTREQAVNHPQSNVLSRAMGVQPSVAADLMVFDIDPADTFLLCSDGVHTYFAKNEELSALIGTAQEPAAAVSALLAAALERGGHDNCTAILLKIPPEQTAEVNRTAGPDVAAQQRIAILQKIPIFAHLTYHELVKVLGLTQMSQLPPSTTFIHEGQTGHELFVILDGEVEITRNGATLTTLTSGAHIGEMAMVDNAPRSATVFTRRDTTLLVMRRDEFFGIIRGEPVIATKLLWSFLKVISNRLRKTNDALHVAQKDVSSDTGEFDIFGDA